MPKKPVSRTTSKPQSKHAAGAELHIRTAAAKGQLVLVVGTGVSIALTSNKVPALSWKGLIADGFDHILKKGLIQESQARSWAIVRESHDIDDLVSAAEFFGRKIGAPDSDLYGRWLEQTFSEVTPDNAHLSAALQKAHSLGIPISTLNYDHLLERITGATTVTMADTRRVANWIRREESGILHLHGSWTNPASCILGVRDYAQALNDTSRDLIQKSLGAFNTLLFIGCGDTFGDPNFESLIRWLRVHFKGGARQHYALVVESEMDRRNSDPTWHGFVEPLSYGTGHESLAGYLLRLLATVATQQEIVPTPEQAGKPNEEEILNRYRRFLLRDCGQMAIEGVRADMDIGQRKFELEKLFVPLDVIRCPPDVNKSDPHAAQKLQEWMAQNASRKAFGPVFKKKRSIALLALPGAGKTLLLKRLEPVINFWGTARQAKG